MGQWGKAKCLWGNPPKLSTTFLVFFSNHLFLPECGWVSYCMEWEEYGQPKFELGRDPFLKIVFWLPWKEKYPKTYAILLGIHVFQFSHVLGAAGVFPVCLDPMFWLFASFFPGIGGRFCNARAWVVFLTFLELLVHFSIHVFVISWVSTMVGKSHSRFWLSQRLLASHTGYLGHFSLLRVVLTDKLQGCVFFPILWAVLLLRMGLCNSFLLLKLC